MSSVDISNLYEEFVISSVEPILFCDSEGRIVLWNKGCEYLLGYSTEEIKNLTVFSMLEGGAVDSFTLMFETAKKGRTLTFETKFAKKDGKVADVEIIMGALKESGSVYCMIRDMENVARMKDRVKNLSIFPENETDFMMEWEKGRGVTYYNRAVSNFFKKINSGVVHVENILPAGFEKTMSHVAGSDHPVKDSEAEYADHIFSYTFIPHRNNENKVLIIGRDITRLKKLNEEVEDSYEKTSGIIDFIESILKEFRFIDLSDKINLRQFAGLYLRDLNDKVSSAPSYMLAAIENEERLYEGTLYYKEAGEMLSLFDKVIIHPQDLKKILSDRKDGIFANWMSESNSIESFQERFPEIIQKAIKKIENFVSYKTTEDRNGVFVAFNYLKDVGKYEVEALKGFAMAISSLYTFQSLYKEKEEEHLDVFAKVAELAEQKDQESSDHLKRMRSYVRIIADYMSQLPKYKGVIDRNYIKNLYTAVVFHDIGKIGIPDVILQKPGKLTEKEFELMREHTLIGGKQLEGPKFLEMAREIAYYHHEKYDGSGYPYGLKGDDIPLSARIAALADVYDAMTSKRVYKEAFSHDRTSKLISICSGGHFDPDVVNAFLSREQDFIKVKERYKDKE